MFPVTKHKPNLPTFPSSSIFRINNTGQQRICPMRKIVCFWCIFGRWIQICFQNFSITHTFRFRLKGWNHLRRKYRCFFFTAVAMKNSRNFFPWKMVSCFAKGFVPLWKFLDNNISQISGACSLILHKWAWRWFYSTTEIDSIRSLGSCSQHEGKLWKHEATVAKV